jgi:hypothetical protein
MTPANSDPSSCGTENSHAPVSGDSVSAVYSGPGKNLKIKEINGS